MRVLLLIILTGLASAPNGLAAESKPQTQESGDPNKPIRFIIPNAAGSASDVLSRILGERLAA